MTLKTVRVPMADALRNRYAETLARVRRRGFRSWLTRRAWGDGYYAWMQAGLERDAVGGELESVDVTAERLVIGEERGDEGPLLFMDVGDGKVLCLGGQWLSDPAVVRGVERLPADGWFLRFTLIRAPGTGDVVRIEPAGVEVLRAAARVPAAELAFFGQSAIVAGSTADVRAALAPFHALVPSRRGGTAR